MSLKFPRQSSPSCAWVRERLPLFAGGEIPWSDRRKIDRHLIVCPACRRCEVSQQGLLGILRAAAAVAPAGMSQGESPSLWPALAMQIQDAKHSGKVSTFPFASRWRFNDVVSRFAEWYDDLGGLRSSSNLQFRAVPVAMAALLLVSVSVLGVGSWVRRQENLAKAEMTIAARPIIDPEFIPFQRSRGPALPADNANLARNEANSSKTERDGGRAKLNYDLDHGTPMGPDSHDLKPSY